MSATAERTRLRSIKSEKAELRQEIKVKEEGVEAARAAYLALDEPDPDRAEFTAVQNAVAERGEAQERHDKLELEEKVLLESIGGTPPSERGGDGAGIPNHPAESFGGWDSGQLFSDDIVAALEAASKTKGKIGGIQLGEVVSREALAARAFTQADPRLAVPDVEPTDLMRRGPFRGIIPELRRPLSFLDLIPTGTMDGNSFQFVRESTIVGEGAPAAKVVKEGALKPQSSIKYDDDEAVARTIAEYMKLKKQALSDVPALRTAVDSRLRYFIERELERLVLAGTGESEELTGILSTDYGVVKYNEHGDVATDKALFAIVTVLLANCRASGLVMHPLDWAETLIRKAIGEGPNKEDVGDANYYSGGPFATTPQSMWGVPLYPSVVMPRGAILAADFQIGSTLLIREGISVVLSDSDQDDFVRNRVTVLGEMRASHPIWRPEAYAVAFLTKAAEEEAE